jgi:hypothetical protein
LSAPLLMFPMHTPPEPGKTCDTVTGSTQHGRGNFNANSQ